MTTNSPSGAPREPTDPAGRLEAAEAALQQALDREVMLRNRLDHGIRNTMAVIRSVFLRTLDNSESVNEARDHFLGRLDALVRYNARPIVKHHESFDLETMIWDELISISLGTDERITISGPAVKLQNRTANLVGLAVHELVTNSIKFGVLGDLWNGGRLDVRWAAEHDVVDLEWNESGVAIVAPAPIGSGFGRDFIENALPYQLNASTRFDFVPGGLVCRIQFGVGNDHSDELFSV